MISDNLLNKFVFLILKLIEIISIFLFTIIFGILILLLGGKIFKIDYYEKYKKDILEKYIPAQEIITKSKDYSYNIDINKSNSKFVNPDKDGFYKVDKLFFIPNDKYYSAINTLLLKSQKNIKVGMYALFRGEEVDKILENVIQCNKREVEVEIIVDDLKSRNWANKATVKYLKNKDIKIRYDKYTNKISHIKLVVVDEYATFIGSHNWTVSALRYSIESSVLIYSEMISKECKKYLENL